MIDWRKRYPEWSEVAKVYLERRGTRWTMFWHMVKAAWAGPVPRSVWRARILLGCKKCPIFCREPLVHPDGRKWRMNACAGPKGSGCGCWVPTVALSANPSGDGCWAHTATESQMGWPAYRFPSIWHRLWAPIAFLLGR